MFVYVCDISLCDTHICVCACVLEFNSQWTRKNECTLVGFLIYMLLHLRTSGRKDRERKEMFAFL